MKRPAEVRNTAPSSLTLYLTEFDSKWRSTDGHPLPDRPPISVGAELTLHPKPELALAISLGSTFATTEEHPGPVPGSRVTRTVKRLLSGKLVLTDYVRFEGWEVKATYSL